MDINNLLKALDNESNDKLFDLTSVKLREMNKNIINELHLTKHENEELLNKLKEYKYVDELDDLNYGSFIRWIPLNNPKKIELTKGAIFCDTKITDNGMFLVCKNFGYQSKNFCIKMEECLIFQKLSKQELVLLSALDHLS